MKIRTAFVSNSSTTSFLFVSKTVLNMSNVRRQNWFKRIKKENKVVIGEGTKIFRMPWKTEYFTDFGSKLNWLYLSALYANQDSFKDNVFCALGKIFGKDIEIEEKLCSLGDKYKCNEHEGYIDHQSQDYGEKILGNVDDMVQFLLDKNSYIAMANDSWGIEPLEEGQEEY